MKGKKKNVAGNKKSERMASVAAAVGKSVPKSSQTGLRPVSIGKGRKDKN